MAAPTTTPRVKEQAPSALAISGLFAPRYVWGFYARWWDYISECLDMCGHAGTIPGLIQERWSYLDLYETEDTIIADTQGQAEAEFERRYPWITIYHTTLRGEYRPEPPKKARRKSRRANVPVHPVGREGQPDTLPTI